MDTTRLPPDFREFLKLFLSHEVRFLIIGGYAVNSYGYIRNTGDLDVWIEPTPGNRQRAVQALREFAFPSAPGALLDNPSEMLRMGMPPLRIEILQSISGVTFDACWPNRVTFEDGDISVPMISLQDLKANKRATGRSKDQLDVENLP